MDGTEILTTGRRTSIIFTKDVTKYEYIICNKRILCPRSLTARRLMKKKKHLLEDILL